MHRNLIGAELHLHDRIETGPRRRGEYFRPAPQATKFSLKVSCTGTWYINVLAVRLQFRSQGLGTKLLALADETAHRARKVRYQCHRLRCQLGRVSALQAAGLQRASAEADGQRQLAERRTELGPADEKPVSRKRGNKSKGGYPMRTQTSFIAVVAATLAVFWVAGASLAETGDTKQAKITRAMQAAPASISKNATIVDDDGTVPSQAWHR